MKTCELLRREEHNKTKGLFATMEKKLLIIEDDPEVTALVSDTLAREMPFAIDAAADGAAGLEMALGGGYDLIILDLTLPKLSGFDVCREIRQQQIGTAIICLTSRIEEVDKVLALELGADDYVVKPFSPRELAARLKAVLRRSARSRQYPSAGEVGLSGSTSSGANPEDVFTFGTLVINLASRIVTRDGLPCPLSCTEFDLVQLLVERAGRVVSREEILKEVFGYQQTTYDPILTAHISRIRAKIEPSPESPRYLLTSRGAGYRFVTQAELTETKQ